MLIAVHSEVSFLSRNLGLDCKFNTKSWIEKIFILGASKPKKVTLQMGGMSFNVLRLLSFSKTEYI